MLPSRLRLAMRRIALGLPVVGLGGAIAAAPVVLACVCPSGESITHVNQALYDQYVDAEGNIDPNKCPALCAQIDPGVGLGREEDQGQQIFVVGCEPEPGGVAPRIRCDYTRRCVGGRIAPGRDDLSPRITSAGGWLAHLALLEAESVDAFEQLADELHGFDAPASLVDRARKSADDERRHARIVVALCERFGVEPTSPRPGRTAMRSKRDVAMDNAIEGCAREAYGALSVAHQATHAGDPVLRAAFASIARDEARHGELSLDVHDWLAPQLTEPERMEIDAARRDAVASLRSEVGPVDPAMSILGLPEPELAHRWLDVIEAG